MFLSCFYHVFIIFLLYFLLPFYQFIYGYVSSYPCLFLYSQNGRRTTKFCPKCQLSKTLTQFHIKKRPTYIDYYPDCKSY